MDYEKAYKEALERAKSFRTPDNKDVAAYIFPVLKESGDEKIRKALIKLVKKAGEGYENVIDGVSIENAISWIEKQGEQKSANTVKDVWKNMRLEVWAQASGNREANVSCDNTKIFSLCDIDEIIEKINDCQIEQKPAEWSEEDEKMIENIIDTINMSIEDCDVDDVGTKARFTLEKERDWLKNKLKSLRLQSTWKPSKEQMEAMGNVIKPYCKGYGWDETPLGTLYNNLKKLREE